MKAQGARIGVWGIGTRLVSGDGEPALGCVYKLSAIRAPGASEWSDRIKLSEQALKTTTPGVQQVRRYRHPETGVYVADVVYDERHPPSGAVRMVDFQDPLRQKDLAADWPHEDLLLPIFRGGRRVYQVPDAGEARARTLRQLPLVPQWSRRLANPHAYPVGLESHLAERRLSLIRREQEQRPAGSPTGDGKGKP